jgi:hypothetical protein
MFVLVGSTKNLGLHFKRSWDMYAICATAMLSAIFSVDGTRTLMYAMWLTLAVYLGTELSLRVRTPRDVVAAIGIVLLPASFLVGIANVTLGPVVMSTGRQFGALGSAHVDTAYAMNYVCLFLALRAMPAPDATLPRWLRLPMLALLAWALHQVVFGLTRSVWLGVLLTLFLYAFRSVLNVRTLAGTLLVAGSATIALSVIGLDRILPEAVKGRMEVTAERYESGQIDPRIHGIQSALRSAMKHPEGVGYAARDSHNSYTDILMQLGWGGFLFAVVAVARSVRMTWRMGFGWFLFFAIGCSALLLQAFFESQSLPGQANFIPLLVWYGLSRARFVQQQQQERRWRPQFVEA